MMEMAEFCRRYAVERRNTNSVKWDSLSERFGSNELLPMWIADMDFKVPEAVQEAMMNRIGHGVFGYSQIPDSYYEAFFNWMFSRHRVQLQREWIRFSTGVVNSLYWMVNAFTAPDDAVMICTPVYHPFHTAVTDNKRKLVCSELIHRDGRYTLDYEDFERQIIRHQVKLFILCSPHNPVGRVWTGEELGRLFDICVRYGVMIVSDEIHQDFVRSDTTFTSAVQLQDYWSRLIVLNSASKTFNLAGLLNSHIIIPDVQVRKRYDDYARTVNKAEYSLMGWVAAEACYRQGSEWYEGLLKVVEHNFRTLQQTLCGSSLDITISDKEGTYLAWIDLGKQIKQMQSNDITSFIQQNCKIAVSYGEQFGLQSRNFIRINLATPPNHIDFAAKAILNSAMN